MRHGRQVAADRYGAGARQEGGLIRARYVGTYPGADFPLHPTLPEIALIGRSNVGKSSLINTLVGRRSLARISRSPGKTQACNVYVVDDQVYLLDLPGYGYARVSKARRAAFRRLLRDVVAHRTAMRGALWLLDIRHVPSREDAAMQEVFEAHGTPVLLVVTKSDKLARGKRGQYVRTILDALNVPESQCVVTSAQTREGIADLRESIAALAGTRAGTAR
jgi:GTP-binding protein